MIVRTTPRLAKLGPRVRLAVLVLFSLLVAHDGIYLAQFGWGSGFQQAMSEGGSHAYWLPTSIAIALAGVATFLATLAVLVRLQQSASRLVQGHAEGPGYASELVRTWKRLYPLVTLLYGVQENVEHLASHGHLAGLDPLFGPGSDLALPVLAFTTFVLAAIGALLRWRISVLEGRMARARRAVFPRIEAHAQPAGWRMVAAIVAHGRILVRRDAGRAPPPFLPVQPIAA